MADSSEQRNYNLTDAELCMYTSNLCVFLTRDLSELSVFGVSAAKITALKALGDAFEVFPSDVVLLAYIKGKTEEKNALMEQVKEQIRNMATRCQIKWGENSWQESSLGIKGMNQFTEDSLLVAARRVHEQMTEFLPDLADVGLTQAVLDDFDALNESFEVSRNNLNKKIAERDMKTQERITDGNNLYKLVSDYCEIGKRVYAKTNPAKYNDYIIYAPTPGGLTAPKNFRFFRGSRVFTWDLVENATRYEVEMSLDQIEWNQIFYESWNEIEVDVPDGFSYYRCRAHNSGGFGDFCDVLAIEYYRFLPTPQNFRLELVEGTPKKARCLCDAVPTAELYMTYMSVVNIGASPGNWTGAASNELPEVLNELVLGKRNYFQIQAQNEGQSSLKTDALYLDVAE